MDTELGEGAGSRVHADVTVREAGSAAGQPLGMGWQPENPRRKNKLELWGEPQGSLGVSDAGGSRRASRDIILPLYCNEDRAETPALGSVLGNTIRL
ncbi:hypothetical protein NDU88_007934 [Pleurodeles waltl]|uniref:Uncharacterized protein n=1 Tax=Pleurodeles waltl TaxID=8319 RepID=A0AAV7QM44_PLEWA|nr:hypothetical protein NDU88_007934 [Pleurodeles waltl]